MNMVIDAGNTRTKVGIFEGALLKQKEVFADAGAAKRFLCEFQPDHLMISSVTGAGAQLGGMVKVLGRIFHLAPSLPLPIQNSYTTPATLGADRLAAACGARQMFPNEAILVIDCGTCINYECVDAQGHYLGGSISPGVRMRFGAMHQHTDRLPLGEAASETPLTGNTTILSLQSGVMIGVQEEIKGISTRYRQDYPGIRVILTGGDAHFFEKEMKPPIFVSPELVLMGLNSILLHNVNL